MSNIISCSCWMYLLQSLYETNIDQTVKRFASLTLCLSVFLFFCLSSFQLFQVIRRGFSISRIILCLLGHCRAKSGMRLDGMEWTGWSLVIRGLRSSKSTFAANRPWKKLFVFFYCKFIKDIRYFSFAYKHHDAIQWIESDDF